MAVTRTWTNLARDPKATQVSGGALTYWAVWGPSFGSSPNRGTGATSIPGVSSWAEWDATGSTELALSVPSRPGDYGGRVTASIWAYSETAGFVNARISVYNIATSTEQNIVIGAPVPIASNTWVRVSATVEIPAGNYRLSSGAIFTWDTPASGKIRATAAAIIPAVDDQDYSGPSFDGDTTDTVEANYSWAGVANDSASYAVITVPQVTPLSIEASSAAVTPVPLPESKRVYKPLYLKSFSVQEDSMPIYASDMSGGAGSMTLQVDENGDTPYFLETPIDLIDPSQGTTRGTIRGVASDDTNATLTADSRIALLNVTREAAPFSGTLGNALRYYLGLCGITDGIVVEATLEPVAVSFLGFAGNVLERIKSLCPVYAIDMSLISNNIVFRPIRKNVSENYRDSATGWSYDTTQKAQKVDIYKYDVTEVTGGLVYPYGGWNSDVQVLSVEAGQTQEYIIPVEGSLLSVNQPTYTVGVGPTGPGFSAYEMMGADNLPIPKAQWESQGGALSVAISDDSRSLIVTITGANEAGYSPYRVARSDGETQYSTLRIYGSATMYTKELHTYHTASDPDRVSNEVGATIDNDFIQTYQQLLDVAMGELRYYGGNRRTITVTTGGINRLGDNGSYAYATMQDFNAWWNSNLPGATFAGFNTAAPPVFGATFDSHNEWWIEEVQDDFANQAFGNIAGARVRTETNIHRIRSATVTEAGIQYTAWEDSIFADHNQLWGAGSTFANFNAAWAGQIFSEYDATPLIKGGT